jgi:hypothetical protein
MALCAGGNAAVERAKIQVLGFPSPTFPWDWMLPRGPKTRTSRATRARYYRPIPLSLIQGKVTFRLLSLSRMVCVGNALKPVNEEEAMESTVTMSALSRLCDYTATCWVPQRVWYPVRQTCNDLPLHWEIRLHPSSFISTATHRRLFLRTPAVIVSAILY